MLSSLWAVPASVFIGYPPNKLIKDLHTAAVSSAEVFMDRLINVADRDRLRASIDSCMDTGLQLRLKDLVATYCYRETTSVIPPPIVRGPRVAHPPRGWIRRGVWIWCFWGAPIFRPEVPKPFKKYTFWDLWIQNRGCVLWRFWCLGMKRFGAIPLPPACARESPSISAILARYYMKTSKNGCDAGIPPSAIRSRQGIARCGGVSRTGPLS